MIDARTLGGTLRALASGAADHPIDRRLFAAVAMGYPAWQGLVRGARALDWLFVPQQAQQPITAPVFVVGHPRSGTTLFHRMMALDRTLWAPLAWELALPAVTLHRAVELAGRARVGTGFAGWSERALFDGYRERHLTRWHQPEEDDWLLLQAAASPTLEFLTGRPEVSRRWWIGDDLPVEARRRVMQWYRRSMQRILYAAAPEATWLSKNPHFTGWLRTLAGEFPGARFIMLVRDPADAIASRMSSIARAWQRGPIPGRADPRMREVFAASCGLYRHAEAVWTEIPAERRLRVSYDRLVRDPTGTLTAARAHFGWSTPPGLAAALEAAAVQARRRVPAPRAKLRHVGIPPSALEAAIGDLDTLWTFVRENP